MNHTTIYLLEINMDENWTALPNSIISEILASCKGIKMPLLAIPNLKDSW